MLNPVCERRSTTTYALGGVMASYLRAITDQWLRVAPEANPAMLEMFRDRDRTPRRALEPWAGEFAGKYLTAATQVLRLTGDPALKAYLEEFVKELVSLQAEDGYLGPWPEEYRLTNKGINVSKPGKEGHTWDAWGHYHIMLGLLFWHDDTGNEQALACAAHIADLICKKYLEKKSPRLVDTGSTEMNLAPIHALCLLYKKRQEGRYLEMALQIADEFSAKDPEGQPLAGDYLNGPLAGKEFFQLPKPRWESLHPIMGLVELYYLTGEEKYRKAFERVWWSIVKLDRHNNGGFSSGEQAQGNPYHQGAIETCCTIAWIALGVEMLRLSGNSIVADELELSTLNSVVGMHSYTGRWATYNTPMDGVRKASAHEIVFQSREGSPELNCCSVNSARGFGMISDWALMADAEGLVLNWYGPGTMRTVLPSGVLVTLVEETEYPRQGKILIYVSPPPPTQFALKLRIPHWSANTKAKLNGEGLDEITPGGYLTLNRRWELGDTVEIELDMSPHYWVGEQECAGKVSIYRGPLLLTYDRRFNDMDPDDVPALDARQMDGRLVAWPGRIPPLLLMEFVATDGRKVRLCDFGSAGEGGTPYRSWLPVVGAPAVEFTPQNPLRSGRA